MRVPVQGARKLLIFLVLCLCARSLGFSIRSLYKKNIRYYYFFLPFYFPYTYNPNKGYNGYNRNKDRENSNLQKSDLEQNGNGIGTDPGKKIKFHRHIVPHAAFFHSARKIFRTKIFFMHKFLHVTFFTRKKIPVQKNFQHRNF